MRVAVIGAGVVGLATAAYLLDVGAEVTCYESAAPMSGRSAGSSRIFRLAHATPELVGLAQAALRGYEEWGSFVRPTGAVVRGPELDPWIGAMASAGADHRVDDHLDLPVLRGDGPVLVDPAGGVIDAEAVGAHLLGRVAGSIVRERVERLDRHDTVTRLWTAQGPRDTDATVICAGAGTPGLAAQVGIEFRTPTAHHARFTFRLEDPAVVPPCVLDSVTYQHLTAPGQWAVGVHAPAGDIAWERGRANVVAHLRDLTSSYVRDHLTGVDDHPVGEVYCTFPVGWGDGYVVARSGGFLAVHGDNLFKLAPVLGRSLGKAALDGSTPASTHP